MGLAVSACSASQHQRVERWRQGAIDRAMLAEAATPSDVIRIGERASNAPKLPESA